MSDIDRLREIVAASKKTVFFGGAGVSTESGIPDFRSANGIFVKNRVYSPEEIVSHGYFFRDTEGFYKFYREKMLFPKALPNAAHLKLAEWEREGKLSSVITQNIDGLHQKAGSKRVLELHGSALRNYCLDCGEFYDIDYILNSDGVPRCKKCGGIIKPDVVLYEESLDGDVMEETYREVTTCETLIVGGTSLVVYPAASFVYAFKGKNLILINATPTGADRLATLAIRGKIGEVLGSL